MPETSNNTVGEFTLFSQQNIGEKNTATNCRLQHRLSSIDRPPKSLVHLSFSTFWRNEYLQELILSGLV